MDHVGTNVVNMIARNLSRRDGARLGATTRRYALPTGLAASTARTGRKNPLMQRLLPAMHGSMSTMILDYRTRLGDTIRNEAADLDIDPRGATYGAQFTSGSSKFSIHVYFNNDERDYHSNRLDVKVMAVDPYLSSPVAKFTRAHVESYLSAADVAQMHELHPDMLEVHRTASKPLPPSLVRAVVANLLVFLRTLDHELQRTKRSGQPPLEMALVRFVVRNKTKHNKWDRVPDMHAPLLSDVVTEMFDERTYTTVSRRRTLRKQGDTSGPW